ncbi:MAG: tRNA pseudouridine(55) synthase TruB [Gemmatimonadota bacterium]
MLLVAKTAGPTSHDVVDVVRRALGVRRVGHLGTLDPFADGLLVLVVGRATRLAQFASGWRKEYRGTMRLGAATTTDDVTGATVATSDVWRALDRAAVEAALAGHTGPAWQRPPAHSAVKVAGERAYRRARRGETVELASRPVDIETLVLEDWTPPDLRFRAIVSAGTYVRSIARDVGETLGCGAHLVALTRTAVGPFRLEDARVAETVTAADLRPAALLVGSLPSRELDEAERAAVIHGRTIPAREADGTQVALLHAGQLVAVAEAMGGMLKPRVVVVE